MTQPVDQFKMKSNEYVYRFVQNRLNKTASWVQTGGLERVDLKMPTPSPMLFFKMPEKKKIKDLLFITTHDHFKTVVYKKSFLLT